MLGRKVSQDNGEGAHPTAFVDSVLLAGYVFSFLTELNWLTGAELIAFYHLLSGGESVFTNEANGK